MKLPTKLGLLLIIVCGFCLLSPTKAHANSSYFFPNKTTDTGSFATVAGTIQPMSETISLAFGQVTNWTKERVFVSDSFIAASYGEITLAVNSQLISKPTGSVAGIMTVSEDITNIPLGTVLSGTESETMPTFTYIFM